MRLAQTSVLAASVLCLAGPARAEMFAVAQSSDGARVQLYSVAGPCVGSARLAEHISSTGEKTPGCWILAEGTVLVSFLDGDRGNIPVAHLKRVSGL